MSSNAVEDKSSSISNDGSNRAPDGDPQAATVPNVTPESPASVTKSDGKSTSLMFIATFLDLSPDHLSQLQPAVVEKLTARANEFEVFKSQKLVDDVKYVKIMRQSLHKAESEREESAKTARSLQAENNSLNSIVDSLKRKFTEQSDQEKTLEARMDRAMSDQKATLAALEQKADQCAKLQEELTRSHEEILRTKKTVVELESRLSTIDSDQLLVLHREQTLVREKELLENNNKWLDKELETRAQELRDFRRENLAELSKVQNELDTKTSEFDALKASYNALTEQFSNLSGTHESTLLKIAELKDANAVAEENFVSEMSAQKRLNQLLELSNTDFKRRVAELETNLKNLRDEASTAASTYRQSLQTERANATKLKERLQSLEDRFENYCKDEIPLDSRPSEIPRADEPPTTPASQIRKSILPMENGMSSSNASLSGAVSPSAHIIAEIRKSGGSLVQLYSDYKDMRHLLERERHKNEDLRRDLESVMEEIESHAPDIMADREENQRLELELADMSLQLEQSTKQLEDYKIRIKVNEQKASDLTRENKLQTQLAKDLSRQVQYLLIHLQTAQDQGAPLDSRELEKLQKLVDGEDSLEGDSDSDRLISQRLVLFKDLVGLQQQNENLIKVTREWAQKLEDQETLMRNSLESEQSEAVREARKAIIKLQQELQTRQSEYESVKKQRDMFRQMVSKNESSSQLQTDVENEVNGSNSDIIQENSKLRSELNASQEHVKVLRMETNESIERLNDQLTHVSQKRSELQIQLSRAQGQLELTEERHKTLNGNYEMIKVENTELKRHAENMRSLLTAQDLRTQKVADELVEARTTTDKARAMVSQLTAEKSMWASAQERLQSDYKRLSEERDKLNSILTNLRTGELERISSLADARDKLQETVQELQSKLISAATLNEETISKLHKDLESVELERSRMKGLLEAKELEMANLQQIISNVKAELSLAQQSKETASIEISTLKERIAALEKLQHSEGTGELLEQITTLTSQLSLAKNELFVANDHVKELESFASRTEASFADISKVYEEYRTEAEGRYQKLESRSTCSKTQKLLENTTTELTDLRQKYETILNKEKQKSESLERTLETLRSEDEQLNSSLESLKHDLTRQAEIAREAQENYEKELKQHAKAAEISVELRSELAEQKALVERTSEERNVLLDEKYSAESRWKEMIAENESQKEELAVKLDALAKQNGMLLDQLESLSEKAVHTRQDGSENQSAQVESSPRLFELVGSLRREKEIEEVNLSLQTRECKNLKQKLEHTSAALDVAKLQLEEEKQKQSRDIEMKASHEKLMQQISDLNILRESNATLRQQSEYYAGKCESLKSELEGLEKKLEPLESQVKLQAHELQVKADQISSLEEDNERWKKRTQDIIHRHGRVDPASIQEWKEKITSLSQQVEELQKVKSALESSLSAGEAKLNQKDVERRLALNQYEKLREENGRIKEEAQDFKDQMTKANQEIQVLKKSLESHQTRTKELSSNLDQVTSERSAVKSDLESLQQKYQKLYEESREKLSRRRIENLEVKSKVAELEKKLAEVSSNKSLVADASVQNVESLRSELAELMKKLESIEREKLAAEQAKIKLESEMEVQIKERDLRIAYLETSVKRIEEELSKERARGMEQYSNGSDIQGDDKALVAGLIETRQNLEKEVRELNESIVSLKTRIAILESAVSKERASTAELRTKAETYQASEKYPSPDAVNQIKQLILQDNNCDVAAVMKEALGNVEIAPVVSNVTAVTEAEIEKRLEMELKHKFEKASDQKLQKALQEIQDLKKQHEAEIARSRDELIQATKEVPSINSGSAQSNSENLTDEAVKRMESELKEKFAQESKKAVSQVKAEAELRVKLLQRRADTLLKEKEALIAEKNALIAIRSGDGSNDDQSTPSAISQTTGAKPVATQVPKGPQALAIKGQGGKNASGNPNNPNSKTRIPARAALNNPTSQKAKAGESTGSTGANKSGTAVTGLSLNPKSVPARPGSVKSGPSNSNKAGQPGPKRQLDPNNNDSNNKRRKDGSG